MAEPLEKVIKRQLEETEINLGTMSQLRETVNSGAAKSLMSDEQTNRSLTSAFAARAGLELFVSHKVPAGLVMAYDASNKLLGTYRAA